MRIVVVFLAASVLLSCAEKEIRLVDSQPLRPNDGYFENQSKSRYQPIVGTRGMVVAVDRTAAEWGVEILRQGGNAMDAAVATGFALAVTSPNAAAIGGGGFMVYCPRPSGGKPSDCVIIDYREKAPAKAHRNMYIVNEKPRPDLSQDHALSSGVPGVTAGLLTALEKYGTMNRKKILSRPIQLARRGFHFTGALETKARGRWKIFNPEAKRIFACLGSVGVVRTSRSTRVGGLPKRPCVPGQLLKQPDLARVLETIAQKGKNGFYRGWVAAKIARGLNRAGGIMTEADLASYRAKIRLPVKGIYRGMEIVTMPPPSAGGATMIQMFGWADRADRTGAFSEGVGSPHTVHALVHGMSLAFADRAVHFGDPDLVKVPVKKLLTRNYLDGRWDGTWKPGKMNLPPNAGAVVAESNHTTHFSVIDKWGNAAAVTTTINYSYGSGFVPPGTGVVMNNEMDDFSMQPGVPNIYGLVGAEANSIRAHKRPLSSMSPTIVRDRKGNNRIVIGASGGPRITTSVFLSLMNRLRFGMTLPDAVAAPRFHHQWKPDVLYLERHGYSPAARAELHAMGYSVRTITGSARIHALERFPESRRVWGVPDRRAEGTAIAE